MIFLVVDRGSFCLENDDQNGPQKQRGTPQPKRHGCPGMAFQLSHGMETDHSSLINMTCNLQ